MVVEPSGGCEIPDLGVVVIVVTDAVAAAVVIG